MQQHSLLCIDNTVETVRSHNHLQIPTAEKKPEEPVHLNIADRRRSILFDGYAVILATRNQSIFWSELSCPKSHLDSPGNC